MKYSSTLSCSHCSAASINRCSPICLGVQFGEEKLPARWKRPLFTSGSEAEHQRTSGFLVLFPKGSLRGFLDGEKPWCLCKGELVIGLPPVILPGSAWADFPVTKEAGPREPTLVWHGGLPEVHTELPVQREAWTWVAPRSLSLGISSAAHQELKEWSFCTPSLVLSLLHWFFFCIPLCCEVPVEPSAILTVRISHKSLSPRSGILLPSIIPYKSLASVQGALFSFRSICPTTPSISTRIAQCPSNSTGPSLNVLFPSSACPSSSTHQTCSTWTGSIPKLTHYLAGKMVLIVRRLLTQVIWPGSLTSSPLSLLLGLLWVPPSAVWWLGSNVIPRDKKWNTQVS